MEILVKFFANFREMTDVSKEKFEVNDHSTVIDLLDQVTKEYPDLSNELFEDEELSSYVNVLINHRNIKDIEGLDTKLEQNDSVAIFPPVSGG